MPFDGTHIIDHQNRVAVNVLAFGTRLSKASAVVTRPLPVWHALRRPENVGATIAVLVRARELIGDERLWCKRSFAVGWLGIPVPVRSIFARRYCALGAIMRAGRELGLPAEVACQALEWQTVCGVADWNDAACRIHDEVVAAFDAAIDALDPVGA